MRATVWASSAGFRPETETNPRVVCLSGETGARALIEVPEQGIMVSEHRLGSEMLGVLDLCEVEGLANAWPL